MICPCGCIEVDVVDSRQYGAAIKRRRFCRACSRRFSTIEIRVEPGDSVLLSTGRRGDIHIEPFSHDSEAGRHRALGASLAAIVERAIRDSNRAATPPISDGDGE